MSSAADPDLDLILAAVRRTRGFHTKATLFFALLAAFMAVVAAADGQWALGAFGVAFFGGLALLGHYLGARSSDPERSPILAALMHAPDDVVEVRHRTASSSSGHFVTHWLGMRTRAGKRGGLRVDEDRIVELAEALARRCPRADIDVPGFRRAVIAVEVAGG